MNIKSAYPRPCVMHCNRWFLGSWQNSVGSTMADIPVPPPAPPPSDPPPPIIQPDQPQSGGPSPPSRSTRSTPRSDAEAPHDDSSDDEGEDEDVEDPTQRPTMVVLWAGISTFFVETSVHGFKYIVEDTAALWEKLFWTITLCLSLTTAGKPSCPKYAHFLQKLILTTSFRCTLLGLHHWLARISHVHQRGRIRPFRAFTGFSRCDGMPGRKW